MKDSALDYIKHVLEVKDWSASRLASEASLSPSTISRPMRDPKWAYRISRRTIEAVYKCSGVDPAPFGLGISTTDQGGMSSPEQQTIAGRSLGQMTRSTKEDGQAEDAQAPKTDIKIGIHGRFVQIVATVDKAAINDLRRKLDAIEAILDD